jgi:hypothetical protein
MLTASLNPGTADNLAVLLRGAILSWRDRTVTACIASAWPWSKKHWTAYENTIRKAKIHPFPMGRALLHLIIKLVPVHERLVFIVDETLVRRYGPWVSGLGIHRDAVRSSKNRAITTPGHKWVTLAIGLRLDSYRFLALPIFSVLYTSKKQGKRSKAPRFQHQHRTVGQLTLILLRIVAGWAKKRHFFLVGDGAYGTHELADALNLVAKHPTLRRGHLISRLHKEAALYANPIYRKQRGRPPVVGKRLASPLECASRKQSRWKKALVAWYGGLRKAVLLLHGEGLWYKCGSKATKVKWVVVRDPDGIKSDEVFFSTDTTLKPRRIVEMFVSRWALETTFQEVRRHLGLETMRNWSRTAVTRSVPLLFGLYSLIVVNYFKTYKRPTKLHASQAWYRKAWFTFSDLMVMARREVLREGISLQSAQNAREFLFGQASRDTGNAGFSPIRRVA